LITGANGFIGSRLCRVFIDRGFEVFAGVRKTSKLSLIDGLDVTCRYADLADRAALRDMVAGVDYIVHNAGVVKVRQPEQFIETNERGTRNFFEAVLAANQEVRKVVYISSLAAAGPSTPDRKRTEADPPNPITVYGRSKLAGEKVALSYSDQFPVVAVRPSGVYGPGDKEVLAFFQTVKRGLKPILGNTDRKLQMVHVDDLCRAVFLATTVEVASGSVYFVCEQSSYTFRELIGHIRTAVESSISIPIVLPAPVFRMIAAVSEFTCKAVGATPMLTREKAGELLAWWEVDTSRAKAELGFESEIPFAEGARQTAAWYVREGWL
jgi:nucleoside-diphosphate-sugar epimerase